MIPPYASTEPLIFNMPALPLELTDCIIDFVAILKVKRLRANLAACSLVCRTWTRRSRHHFFKACRLLVSQRNLLAFDALLRSPLCTILPHVRQLTLENNGGCRFDPLGDALKLLPNMESLRLAGSEWGSHGAPPRRGFMTSLAGVVELEVNCADVGEFDHALQVFCAFPSLRSLAIRGLTVTKDARWHTSPPPPFVPVHYVPPANVTLPQSLSSLLIDARALIPIVHWLNWAGACHIRSLELVLPPIEPQNLTPLTQYVQSLSGSLEHLTLCSSLSTLLEPAHLEHTFDLRAFTHLQTLRFNGLFPIGHLCPFERALPAIVTSVPPHTLQRITFGLDGVRADALPQLDWRAVDAALVDVPAVRFRGRTVPRPPPARTEDEVYDELETPELHAMCVRDIHAALPRAVARGALDVAIDALKTAYVKRELRSWRNRYGFRVYAALL
ncbi:hypothetical protein B0H10DRAFT_2218397 [Mycena sp. CBHHK59/15]|nr:hypothetical protein B0H10DRAFT_2218397 [Mycena sp. CBHHK59/15]